MRFATGIFLAGLAGAGCLGCSGASPITPLDMSPAQPAMVWAEGIGMPASHPRDGMPVVLTSGGELVGYGGEPITSELPPLLSLSQSLWSGVALAASAPGRVGHCAALLPGPDRALYVGGHDGSGAATPTSTTLAITTPAFSPVTGGPGAVDDCAAAYLPSLSGAIVFGGSTPSGLTDATWLFDGSAFSQLAPAAAPSPRSGAGLAYDPGPSMMGRLVLFGGAADDGDSEEIWLFDGTSWGLIGTTDDPNDVSTDEPRPVGRSQAAVAIDPTRRLLYVFGGVSQGQVLGDLWRLDLRSFTWQRLALPGAPTGRAQASVAYDPIGDRLLVFGGRTESGPLGDGWQLSPAP